MPQKSSTIWSKTHKGEKLSLVLRALLFTSLIDPTHGQSNHSALSTAHQDEDPKLLITVNPNNGESGSKCEELQTAFEQMCNQTQIDTDSFQSMVDATKTAERESKYTASTSRYSVFLEVLQLPFSVVQTSMRECKTSKEKLRTTEADCKEWKDAILRLVNVLRGEDVKKPVEQESDNKDKPHITVNVNNGEPGSHCEGLQSRVEQMCKQVKIDKDWAQSVFNATQIAARDSLSEYAASQYHQDLGIVTQEHLDSLELTLKRYETYMNKIQLSTKAECKNVESFIRGEEFLLSRKDAEEPVGQSGNRDEL